MAMGQGMMQMREGSGKSWYSPQRDLAYVLPSIVSAGLKAMGDCENPPNTTHEEVCAVAVGLAKIFVDIAGDKPPTKDEVIVRLAQVRVDHPAAMREVCLVVFSVLMGAYRQWIGDIRPKTPDDKPLDASEMQALLEKFAKPGN